MALEGMLWHPEKLLCPPQAGRRLWWPPGRTGPLVQAQGLHVSWGISVAVPGHVSGSRCCAPARALSSVERREGVGLGQSGVSREGHGHRRGLAAAGERSHGGHGLGSEGLRLCPATCSLMKTELRPPGVEPVDG